MVARPSWAKTSTEQRSRKIRSRSRPSSSGTATRSTEANASWKSVLPDAVRSRLSTPCRNRRPGPSASPPPAARAPGPPCPARRARIRRRSAAHRRRPRPEASASRRPRVLPASRRQLRPVAAKGSTAACTSTTRPPRVASRDFPDQGHRAAPAAGGCGGAVLPVVHPADHEPAPVRGVAEGDGRVVVPAPVQPAVLGHPAVILLQPLGDRGFGTERDAVERSEEVLAAGTAGDPAGAQVHHQHPLGVSGVAVHRQLKQVRAFPHSPGGVRRAEGAQVLPGLEVGGLVEDNFAVQRFDGDHHPVAAGVAVVPEDLGVAEVGGTAVQHGVPGVFRPGGAVVRAVGEGLRLPAGQRGCGRIGAGVDGHERRVVRRCRSRWCCARPARRNRRRWLPARRRQWPRAVRPSAAGPRRWRGPRTCCPSTSPDGLCW